MSLRTFERRSPPNLDDDSLSTIFRFVLVPTADVGGAVRNCRDERINLVLDLAHTVFIALVSKAFARNMFSTFEMLVSRLLESAYQVVRVPNDHFTRGIGIVTEIGGVFLSKQRFLYARTRFDIPKVMPTSHVQQSNSPHAPGNSELCFTLYKRLCQINALHLRDYKQLQSASRRALGLSCQQHDMAIAYCAFTDVGANTMIKNAPLELIQEAYLPFLGDHRTMFKIEERDGNPTPRLFENCAHHGRVDVLDRLVHSDPDSQRSYDRLHSQSFLLTESNVLRGRSGAGPVMRYVVIPAVLGDRPEVLAWLRKTNADLHDRHWSTLTPWASSLEQNAPPLTTRWETAPFTTMTSPELLVRCGGPRRVRCINLGRQPFGPTWYRSVDFTISAVLAVQTGATRVLDWMYDVALNADTLIGEDAHLLQYRHDRCASQSRHDLVAHLWSYRIALICLAFTGTGFVPRQHAELFWDGYLRRGVCALWGMRRWRELHAELQAHMQTVHGASYVLQPCFYGLLQILNVCDPRAVASNENAMPFEVLRTERLSWISSDKTGASHRCLPTMLSNFMTEGLGFVNAVLCTSGDAERYRWIRDETLPGGFLDRVVHAETDPDWGTPFVGPAAFAGVVLWSQVPFRDFHVYPSDPMGSEEDVHARERLLFSLAHATPSVSNFEKTSIQRWDPYAMSQSSSIGTMKFTDQERVLRFFNHNYAAKHASYFDWIPLSTKLRKENPDLCSAVDFHREPCSVHRGWDAVLAAWFAEYWARIVRTECLARYEQEPGPGIRAFCACCTILRVRVERAYVRNWPYDLLREIDSVLQSARNGANGAHDKPNLKCFYEETAKTLHDVRRAVRLVCGLSIEPGCSSS